MTVSANVKRGWLHHPKKESICLNIGSKEYNSALDNGYVRNLTEIDEEYFNPEKEETTEIEASAKRTAELEASYKERENKRLQAEAELEASAKRIAELEASLKEKENKRLQAEAELEASAKRIAELEASLKEKKQSKKG